MTQKSMSDDFIEVMAAIKAVQPADNSDPYRHAKRQAAEAAARAIANGISTAWGVLGVVETHESVRAASTTPPVQTDAPSDGERAGRSPLT